MQYGKYLWKSKVVALVGWVVAQAKPWLCKTKRRGFGTDEETIVSKAIGHTDRAGWAITLLKYGDEFSNWRSNYIASGNMVFVLVAIDRCHFGE